MKELKGIAFSFSQIVLLFLYDRFRPSKLHSKAFFTKYKPNIYFEVAVQINQNSRRTNNGIPLFRTYQILYSNLRSKVTKYNIALKEDIEVAVLLQEALRFTSFIWAGFFEERAKAKNVSIC